MAGSKERIMRKAAILSIVTLVGVMGVSQAHAKKYTQKELNQCMKDLKAYSAKKGYPITDPMVLRFKCSEMLKKKK